MSENVAVSTDKNLSQEGFVEHLVSVGWKRDEAEAEWEAIQNEDESGYDGA